MIGQDNEQQTDNLEAMGFSLAVDHVVMGDNAPKFALYRQLALMPLWLEEAKRFYQNPSADAVRIADWLLDNDYQVLRAIRQAQGDLPASFYRRLPALQSDAGEYMPRLLSLAHGALRSMPKQLSLKNLTVFVNGYQKHSTLNIAELWALPSFLRLASLENLVDGFEQANPVLKAPCAMSPCAIENRVAEPVDRISQAINSLASVQSIEWQDFIDQTCEVEHILCADPVAAYASMNFQTRNKYRSIVEKLCRGADATEADIARKAVDLAKQAFAVQTTEKQAHVGYWLSDSGRSELESSIGYRAGVADRIRKLLISHAQAGYGLGLGFVLLLALLPPVYFLADSDGGLAAWVGGIILSLLPATVLSITIVQWLITALINPRVLPSMDFRKAIPASAKTAVVVPVIVGHADDIPQMIKRLEIRRLCNPDPMLHFVLLSDLPDAPQERVAEDDGIEKALVEQINGLNRKYQGDSKGRFYLLHRHRHYNPAQECWMGRERKRGKLEQFNQFVLSGDQGEFSLHTGEIEQLRDCRFVITLDADTMLPPQTAASLIGIMMHPLNQIELDESTGKVVSGYSIVQPRLEVLPLSGPVSLFCRLYAGDTAIDIYSRAVSNLYQDLFGTGIFVGKGIYDVVAFQRSLENRVPDDVILSHDLFEGIHGRTALASNVVLYENFPVNYPEYILRLHRWVRGDWQLIPWLRSRVPTAGGGTMDNSLSALDRWKIIDNLRRSLLSPALLLFFVGGWMILPGSAWLWTLLAVATPGVYLIGEFVSIVSQGLRHRLYADIFPRAFERSGRWFLSLTFLVSDTVQSLDAIARTLWRLLVSRRNLLQWRSAAHVGAISDHMGSRRSTWRLMWPSCAFAVLVLIVLGLFFTDAVLPAAPILILWFIAPEVSVWIGRPREPRREKLDESDQLFLQQVARRTWHFFETFVGPEDNWLPPDNFQEEPRGLVGHRTSPTNIGLLLTSSQTAHDMGFIVCSDFMIRMRNTLESMSRLKSYRGHLLNWYDTQSLEPLEPRYVSTVDSGNLAICLLCLKQGCEDLANEAVFKQVIWDGLACTFALLSNAAHQLEGAEHRAFNDQKMLIDQAFATARAPGQNWVLVVDELIDRLWPAYERIVAASIEKSANAGQPLLVELHVWLERFQHDLGSLRRELNHFCPWLTLLTQPPSGCEELGRQLSETLSPLALPHEMAHHVQFAQRLLKEKMAAVGDNLQTTTWLGNLGSALQEGSARQVVLREDLAELARRADQWVWEMDFTLLYDEEVRLFRIGFNVSSSQPDRNHYDLLATEARLASYLAIAKGDAPIEHWFFLGRPITRLESRPTILSWNGSMFEYLMPALFVPGHRDTLLGESEAIAVEYQRRYARKHKIPWGISESAFGVTDADDIYQYKAFGAPGLGIRRGLTDDLVVAPYATALALSCWPQAAVSNLQELDKLGTMSIYGFIDALDYTPQRRPPGQKFRAVKTYMAHHQGMVLAAIGNALNDDILIKRTMAEKSLLALEILLQERIPWDATTEKGRIQEEREAPAQQLRPVVKLWPWMPSKEATVPQMHMLGNGRMSTWLSEAGAGGLNWQGHAITRWRPDPTRDAHGYWLYIKDVDTDEVWSAGRLPTGETGHESRTIFHQHLVEDFRRHREVAIQVETTVAPDDDIDIRRVTVVNEGARSRTIEFTSYAEVVLAPAIDDERHEAFSKLFVTSEFNPAHNGLVFNRRPQRPEAVVPVLLHKAVFNSDDVQLVGYESARDKFVGRNDSMRCPLGMRGELSQTTGWTLDPIMALRLRVTLKPNETKSFALLSIVAESVNAVDKIAARYSAVSLDWVYRDSARVMAREVAGLHLEPGQLPAMQALSSLLMQPHGDLRVVPAHVSENRQSQPNLWQFGISGDLPMLMIRIEHDEVTGLLEYMIRAQRLWRRTGLKMDLVVLRIGFTGYEDPLREKILALLRDTSSTGFLGRAGGIHLLAWDHLDPEARRGVEAAAHVVLDDDGVDLQVKLDRILEHRAALPPLEPTMKPWPRSQSNTLKPADLLFDNGIGGFESGSGDYLIYLEADEQTPAPWSNVLANENFGTIVSASNLGFTWAINSGENRLTPLSNDPLLDLPGEVLYLRDEMSAQVWTMTPAPLGADEPCLIRHSSGFTSWQRQSHGLRQELEVFVPLSDPVKLLRINLTNQSDQARRLTATFYAQWLLGALGSRVKPHIVCEYDPRIKAIIASNAWNPDFAQRIAFVSANRPPHSVTGDRYDFLGGEGDLQHVAALRHTDLGGRFNPGGDACAGYQVHIDLAVGESVEVIFMLGQGADRAEAERLINRYQDKDAVDEAFAQMRSYWAEQLDKVQVTTPDPAFDLMVNRWLLYQSIASRMNARAGFYQASGGYGFRDQLQDALAFISLDPKRVREQILRSAAHQFEEGDVQHWWHPPSDRGVRTRCSDDYLWLVYVTSRYICATPDKAILDVRIPFLSAPVLRPDEHDRYAKFDSGMTATLFEHCCRAIDRMLPTGAHGLPLMGTGDWNDGMDRVGVEGKGESVWLAWFQIAVVNSFSPIAEELGFTDRVYRWRQHCKALKSAIDRVAWDGEWFLRAFDDQGEPWGSHQNEECQIDSISQSWGVLSGFGADQNVRTAMSSAKARFLDPSARTVPLLDPPFHATARDPGYIRAYPPGVRENGGQYNHAAAWLGMAFGMQGDGDAAWRVFDLISPIRHSLDIDSARHYGREPYVLTGDIGTQDAADGKGGWSWYTGSASWTWQLGVEGILGLRPIEGGFTVAPALPRAWGGAQLTIKSGQGDLHVTITDPDHRGHGQVELTIDGEPVTGNRIQFPGAGKLSHVLARISGSTL
ncbi:MAG: cyclic beta-1,2-glucan synthetase [Paraglaciecola sp.]|jgi:cyclic beta-1,2-glucan synthetase